MDVIAQGFRQAFLLMASLDPELYGIILLSLKVSGLALAIATVLGLPLGALLALRRLPLRSLIISVMNTFMGLPPVVVGLFLYILLSRSGPLGFLGLLYTPAAMVTAQAILAFPIVFSLSLAAIVGVDPAIRLAARALGATPWQETLTLISEARYGIVAAVIAAFGRVSAEVGAVLMVGGNIAHYTRVMTTTIAMETDKGEFALATALGIILLAISLGVNVLLRQVQRRGGVEARFSAWD
ncbi:MAG: ABC transporter permease [Deltaproteobacteria bacterium]|nr:ABC transporter permease [Deltaproteobacteria bacterium]